jgi:D-alanyl-D-alanine carboxypeptidase
MYRPSSRATRITVVTVALLCACALQSCSRTPSLQDRLQAAVGGYLESHEVPGASVTVIVDGRPTTAVGGLADVDSRHPVSPDTVFPVASVAKLYSAALTMKMVESGDLTLEDPVGRWLPDLPEQIQVLRDATLIQLLSHTTGLPQIPTRDSDRGQPLNNSDLLARMPRPICDPGRCHVYSDGNYTLLGMVIEAASGRTLNEQLQAVLLRPLGLRATFPSGIGRGNDVAVLYRPPERDSRFLENVGPRPSLGTIQTTSGDLAAWGQALFGGEVLEPASLRRMIDRTVSQELPCPEGCPLPYGLGVFHYPEFGGDLVGHDGGSGALVAHDLEDHTTIAIVTNGGSQNVGAFLRAVLEALE